MDFMNMVDMVIIGAIMAVMEIIKSLDTGKKFRRLYPLLVAVLGVAAALFKADPLDWQTVGYQIMVYVAVPSYIFKFGKTTLMGK